MPYVDEAYYNDTFHGEPVNTTDFPSLCLRAEEIVEEMTRYRLTPTSYLTMPGDMQERVKKAVCAQIEYLDANGGAGLGKFNYTRAAGTNGSTGQSVYAPRAQRILFPTGLLYRGGGC